MTKIHHVLLTIRLFRKLKKLVDRFRKSKGITA